MVVQPFFLEICLRIDVGAVHYLLVWTTLYVETRVKCAYKLCAHMSLGQEGWEGAAGSDLSTVLNKEARGVLGFSQELLP